MKSKSRWVTETAIMIALLIILQAITRSLGQLVTAAVGGGLAILVWPKLKQAIRK